MSSSDEENSMLDQEREIYWKDAILGRLVLIVANDNYIGCYTTQNLFYLNSLYGKRQENALVIDDLAILEINKKGDILFVKQNGDLRVYNIQER